jgi:GGDEF domain-containing protein
VLTEIREQIATLIFPEITERRNLLERLAETDELTNLPNRRAFEKAHNRARRERHAFIIFDLNNFGRVNKQCGHAEGDRLLKYYADVIQNVAAKFNARAFRLGGDEFVIIAPFRFSFRLRDAVERRALVKDFGDFCVSVSGEIDSSLAEADSKIQSRKTARKAVK